jgi:spore maturation protein CgeB
MAQDPQDYSERCLYFIQHDDERKQLAEKQRQFVLNNHTYHHRLSGLFHAVGFHDEAAQMLT